MEQQLAQTGETLFTLEFQREAVKNAISAEVLRTMELAVHGMRKAYQHMWVWGKGQRGGPGTEESRWVLYFES